MVQTKRKTVFSADATQLEQIQDAVRRGQYRTSSEFLREAIDEKLAKLRRDRLVEQVADYCDAGFAREDEDLIAAQALEDLD